jgi:ribosomal protein L9
MAKKPARIDKRIEVILLETDKHLGEKYELVKVKAIFAKNVLFPLKRAVLATTDMVNTYKTKMDNAAKSKAKKAEWLASLFDKIAEANGVQFIMKANDRGVLYEKIDAEHIVNRIKELHDIEVESHYFKMKKKITQIGEYTIPFQYGTVDKDIHIVIKAEKTSKKDEHKDSDESEVTAE